MNIDEEKDEYIRRINESAIDTDSDEEDVVEKINWKKEIIDWTKTILFCFVIAFFITRVLILNGEVPTSSMENTIMTGDRFFGNRFSYKFKDPERFDIIVFEHPDKGEELLVKRVIGLPNDKIEIVDGLLYINDEQIDEPYLKEAPYTLDFGPYFVPDDHFFALGDNRNSSIDSRMWVNTYIPRENLVAKPIFKYLPSFEILTDK